MTDDEIISHLAKLHPYWKHGTELYLNRKDILGPKDMIKVYMILDNLLSKKQQSYEVMASLADFITEESPHDEDANPVAQNIVENIFSYFYRMKNDKVFDDDPIRKKAVFLLGYGEILYAIEYRIGLEKRN